MVHFHHPVKLVVNLWDQIKFYLSGLDLIGLEIVEDSYDFFLFI